MFVFEENTLSHSKPIPNTKFELQRRKTFEIQKKHMRYKNNKQMRNKKTNIWDTKKKI